MEPHDRATLGAIYSVPLGLLVLLLFVLLARAWLFLRPRSTRELEAERLRPSFIPQLEGLRGLLAAAVVVFHGVILFLAFPRTHVWPEVPSNFYAQLGVAPVLMFFFLTGYLFWSKLLRAPHLALWPYLGGRLRRLGPVYAAAVLWLLLLVALETHFERRTTWPALLGSIVPWILFTLPGMPDVNGLPATNLLIAGTPWTLAMEWRFYLLLPLLPWFARRLHRCLYLPPPAILIYLAFSKPATSALHLPPRFTEAVHATAGHFVWSFGGGIAVAVLHTLLQRHSRDLPFASKTASIGCIAVITFVMLYLKPRYLSTPESLLLGFVFLCVVSGNTMWGFLSSTPMLLLGKCSYSLYLCHALVLATILGALQYAKPGIVFSVSQAWGLIAVSSALCLATALVVHALVEAPFLSRGRRTHLPARPPEQQAQGDRGD